MKLKKLTKAEVFSLFEAAAKQGNLPEATYRLGLSHITAYGTKMDMGQGVQYIKLAAQNRNLRALYQLAQLNSEGKDIVVLKVVQSLVF